MGEVRSLYTKIVEFFKTLHIKSKWFTIILPLFILGCFVLLVTVNNVYTKTYDIDRFNRSKETIRSPITIENETETKRKTRETVQSVEDRYDISDEITEERINYIEEIFDAIAKLEEVSDDNDEAEMEESEVDDDLPLTKREKILRLREVLSSEIIDSLNEDILVQLIDLTPEERNDGKKVLIKIISEVMDNGVRTENIQSAKAEAKQSLEFEKLSPEVHLALLDLSDFGIVENSFFDAEKTMEARKEAASSVEPVVIRAGEVIVREGQIITNEIYEELKLAGLLNKDRNIFPVIGLILLIILINSVIGYELKTIARKQGLNKGSVTAIFFISIIVISFMKVVSLFTDQMNHLYFVVPIATGALLVKQLINERLAIVLTTLFAILGSIIFNGSIPGSLNVEAGIYFYFSQLAAIYFLTNVKDRLSIVRAGIGIAIINMLIVLIFIFLSFEKYALIDLLVPIGFAVISALLAAVLTIGFLPFFETGLGMLSDIKLLSLANPNQPLMRKLLIEAPGTYHHSVMVANLSEIACETIGANGLLARVGAYYHDIGKTKRPHYFIENQVSIKNPHDFIEPRQSANIIISHPYDGAEMLKEHRLPQEIIDIAKQHHGTTLLKYFYHKEKEKDAEVKESHFRYPGPKPQTKEAAIISICDSVEAAVRSFKEPTAENIDEIVASIVKDRLMDGQFDECLLTLSELKSIRSVICETLKGIFHSRIQYPMEEAE